ncbi:MAG: LysR family transcriptional regulator [Gammaproteobacteria bacterium]|nr:LysR family transcriptional regulator [Gammaproteobacteria bacterium]
MDKLSSMQAFVTVAELGSFSGAAEALRISKAMTTKHIQQLEHALGIRLFSRSTRRLRLTEAGEAYLQGCRDVLGALAELERQVSGFNAKPHGRLKVLAPTSFGSFQLAPVLAEYAHRFPEVQVQLTLSDRPLGLLEEGVDVAIVIGSLHDSSLVARQIAEVRLVVCAAPAYLALHGAPATPADLVGHNCLRYSQGQRKGMWLLMTEEGETVIRVQGDFEATTGDAVRMAAIAGLGLVQLPSYMVRADLTAGRLQPVLAECSPAAIPLFAVYAHREPPATVRTFVAFLEECFHHPL